MKKKILFGNNISDVGRAISNNFNYFNFNVSYCGNTYSNIMKNLENSAYDGLFFFVMYDDDKVCEFVESVRKEYPEMMIYPLLYRNSEFLKESLMESGASQCFTVPTTAAELCFSVIYDFFDEDEIAISIEIAEFLIENGFPNHVKGFYFLCLCIEKVIDEPEMYSNFSKLLYPYVRERTGSSEVWIERSIRNLSKIAYKRGVRLENYPDDRNLSNKTLVKALVDLYCKVNNFRRKK